jgi:hypothetical protein
MGVQEGFVFNIYEENKKRDICAFSQKPKGKKKEKKKKKFFFPSFAKRKSPLVLPPALHSSNAHPDC